MTAAPTAIRHTSTDTLVAVLGGLRQAITQVALSAAGTGVIPTPEMVVSREYVCAHAAVAEILDARLARG
jgi:hypothetical protein